MWVGGLGACLDPHRLSAPTQTVQALWDCPTLCAGTNAGEWWEKGEDDEDGGGEAEEDDEEEADEAEERPSQQQQQLGEAEGRPHGSKHPHHHHKKRKHQQHQQAEPVDPLQHAAEQLVRLTGIDQSLAEQVDGEARGLREVPGGWHLLAAVPIIGSAAHAVMHSLMRAHVCAWMWCIANSPCMHMYVHGRGAWPCPFAIITCQLVQTLSIACDCT